MAPHADLIARLDAIPGVGRVVAEIILAEIGPSVSWPLRNWPPGLVSVLATTNRRANAKWSPTKGQKWLVTALVEAAGRLSQDTYLAAVPPSQGTTRSQAGSYCRGPFHLDHRLSSHRQARCRL
ncbi:hypothetical protein KFU94_42920 [Chloroflexi bacterium TSY]|nr:hypothetical protein [Chloroflexi bacterium TSY]